MKNLLIKEIKLSSSILSYLFILFTLLTFAPGYPILLSGFFVCFGIFHSFQVSREKNDTLYTILLPIRKEDAVKAKLIFTCFIQLVSLILIIIFVIIRMKYFGDKGPYINNALMNATPIYIAFILLIFSCFLLTFFRGFYKTAYNFGKPFVIFIISSFLIILIGETLHHLPGLDFLNTPSGEKVELQILLTLIAFLIYILSIFLTYNLSRKSFDKIDF